MICDEVSAHINMGAHLQRQGLLQEAVVCYKTALELDGRAYQAHNNLGGLFAALGDRETALIFFRTACELNPTAADVHGNLANTLYGEGRYGEAIESYRAAMTLDPANAEYGNHLGNVLRAAGRHAEAQEALQRAIALCPKYPEAHVNLGTCFWEQGRAEHAEACFRRAIKLAPDLAPAHANLSKLLLRRGDFANGWAEAEWRWGVKNSSLRRRRLSQPEWHGESLSGARILLFAEQGYGDTIQFARYVPFVAERGGRVILEVQPELKSLLEALPGVERVIAAGELLPEFNYYCPLMSLPLVFGTDLESIPASVPYLFSKHRRAVRVKQKGLRVGVVWAGSAACLIDHFRSLPLCLLAPLGAIQGVSLVCLQRGPGVKDVFSGPIQFKEYLPESGDFAMTAEWVAGLDLVITVDSAVAHLAGALGKQVWILVPAVSDWRWLVDREDSPWYPTARLFRQRRSGEWGPVVDRVAQELGRLAGQSEDKEMGGLVVQTVM